MDNLIGQKFNSLTVIARGNNTKSGKATWICKCDCGNIKKKSVLGYDLKIGKVTTCGCAYKISNKERNKTHGMTHTRLWNIWQGMRRRCLKGNKHEKSYFQKGITVCEEWEKFENFSNWAKSNGYKDDLTIDRIDNNKGYCPENCRWADYKTQERNKSNNRIITINGVSRVLAEWGEIYGIKPATISYRIKHNWEESRWLEKPICRKKKGVVL